MASHQRSVVNQGRIRVSVSILLAAFLWSGLAALGLRAEAIQATRDIPEEDLLDVGIEVFDAGVPAPGTVTRKKMEGIFPDVRKSEARFIPIRLSETLQATGNWGAVRVVPAGTSSVDVTVAGRIVKSTGKDLVLALRVEDSSGREWLERRYKAEANFLAYSEEALQSRDPYQALYEEIADDMLAVRQRLEPEEVRLVRQITELRFASELAPVAFGSYLRVNRKGRFRLNRLPAEQDPMIERIALIRERDFMFVDTLNEYYAEFQASMIEPYDNWRSFSYEEQVALEELRRQARMRKLIGALAIFGAVISDADSSVEAAARDAAMIGGVAAIQSGIAKGKEAKMHVEALRELGASFESEVAPLVVEVKGETVRLTGSREDQYAAWRQLLRRIYAAETGLPFDPNTESDLSGEQPLDP